MEKTIEKIKMGKGVLVPSYQCNQRCYCCYAINDVEHNKKSMSLEEAKKSIDFMEGLDIKTFTILGGEPLIYPYIEEVVEYGISKGITSWIVTNGLMLVDEDFGNLLFEKGLFGGCISLFSTNREIHEGVTQVAGSYNKAMQAIKNAIKNGWNFHPMITLGSINYESSLNDIEVLHDLGVKTLYLNYGIPAVPNPMGSQFDTTPETLAKMTEELYAIQDKYDMKFIFNREKNKIPLCEFHSDVLASMIECGQIGTGCELVSGNTVVIEPGGSVLGCSHWVENVLMNIYKDYSKLETITTEEFWDIWMNGYPKQFRDSVSYYPYERCAGCKNHLDKKCFGGCKAWQLNGRIEKKVSLSMNQ